ncbi:SCF ubiquitin ligase complex subunit cdc4 [Orbilia brochopaga]|uniref:SCF ubiquitin ligase complex subunit cdc4 n=1 Tax=Orbilia brochopaga TaxID=3140254 RepID=A0AAV9U0P1_9PEZI
MQNHQVNRMENPDTIGQLSFVPTTRTTVVTTTTTTTTSFPPLVIKPPRSLSQLDAKEYPLAASPTPLALKRFCFDLDGHPTYFRESDDPNKTLINLQNLVNGMKDGKGTIRVVEKGDQRYQTPPVSHSSSSLDAVDAISTNPGARKRPASPLSAIELPGKSLPIQKTKRRHTSKSKTDIQPIRFSKQKFPTNQTIITPSSAHLDHTSSSAHTTRSLKPNSGISLENRLSQMWAAGGPEPLHLKDGSLRDTPTPISLSTGRPPVVFTPTEQDGSRFPPELLDHPQPPPSARPLSDSTSSLINPVRESSDASLTTPTNQPPSLPSPSLSPVTAALTLGKHRPDYFSPRLDGAEEDLGSPLALSQVDDCMEDVDGIQFDDSVSVSYGSNIDRLPSLMQLPQMVHTFDLMPQAIKSYLMYQFLRRCDKNTLQFVAGVVNPALKCDFLARLPTELSLNIIKFLDYKSLARAAQVSKKWRVLIDSDEWTWKRLFEEDGYVLADGELERAVREGWGYQDPEGFLDCEKNIQQLNLSKGTFSSSSSLLNNSVRTRKVTRLSMKRSQKQRQTVESLGKDEFKELINDLSSNEGFAAAVHAASANPPPGVGLPSLTNLHLYKSLYRRHHIIRRSWVRPDVQPRHISFRGHQRFVVTCLQFDSEKILTGSDDTNINVYDTNTGALLAKLEGHEGGVWALQYHNNTLVSGSTDRTVRVWDIESAECTQVFHGHTSTVRCLQILLPTKVDTKDGKTTYMPKQPLIITGSRDSTLKIWRLPTKSDKPYRPSSAAQDLDNQPANPYLIRTLQGHGHSVRAIAAHGDTLVSGSYDNYVRVWKISTGECVHRLAGHTAKVYSVVLDHKRNRCISGSMDSCVKVWSLDNGGLLYTLEGHTSLVGLLDLSHDYLVSAAADASLRIWDPETGQLRHTLSAHTGAITCFQHDGHKVISGSDGTLKMWNIKTGRFIRDLLTNLSGVWQVKFNERRCVAAVQRDNLTFIEVLDFGAARDGVPEDQRGRRIVVNSKGDEVDPAEILNDDA